jgi:hypothetical protein
MAMTIISFIIAIIYFIWLSQLISFGVKTATRIAVASEATAANMAILVARLGPPPLPQQSASELGFDAVANALD